MPSWLKATGAAVLKYGALVPGLQPYFQFIPTIAALTPTKKDDALAPVIVSELNQLTGVIVSVEAAGQAIQAGGPQKLQMAAPQIAQIILGSAAMAGKKVEDPAMFQKGVESVTSGWADIMNSVKAD